MSSYLPQGHRQQNRDTVGTMPSLFRFLFVVTALFAVAYGSLYVLSVYFEPEQSEVQKAIPGVKIKR